MRLLFMLSLCLIFTHCKLMKKKDQEQKDIATKKNDMTQRFTPVAWSHNTNIYEVNIRQYTPEGTFNAFLRELPRLKDMGVHTLWLMPITPISQKNRKGTLGSYYACSDYTSINPEFGTLDDFKQLVKEAHQQGFKVIIDWVANHTGWDHVWTVQHPDFYLKDTQTNNFKTPAGMEDIIELDYSNPELKKAMIAAMQYWVKEAGIDGFRCDLASWVKLDFWKEARATLDAVKPLFWLGEFDELENPEYGEAFDASYTWAWMHKTEAFYKQKQPLDSLLGLLKKYDDIGDSTMRIWFTSNHDENSWNGSEYEKYGDTAKALAAFSCTWNGIPLIYSGQELPNKKRLKFFDKDNIEWTGTYEMAPFYKTMLNLHTQNPALRAGDTATHTYILKTSEPGRVLAYMRRNGANEVLVVINMSGQSDLHFEILDENVKGFFKNVFSGSPNDFTTERSFEMQGWEFLIYQK